jgi:hypothetical protein
MKREKTQYRTGKWKFRAQVFAGIMFIMAAEASPTNAQDTIAGDMISQKPSVQMAAEKKRSLKMTTLTFGGNGVYFTKINNQSTVLTGGRGSATFNNRYTIGGGGWGTTKGVEMESGEEGRYSFAKLGYGGIELGYIFYPGKRLNIGTNLLIAGGLIFDETVPESKENDFTMFPVLEPSLYCQIKFSRLFYFEMGTTFRYIRAASLPIISDNQLSGFSCYVGFLVSACSCK